MTKQKSLGICIKCSSKLTDHFCSHCGHPEELKRINGSFIASELASIFNFEKGILFTIKELLIRPGASIRGYIHEDRSGLVKPISFIILSSLIYTLAQHWLKFDDGYMNYTDFEWEDSTIKTMINWISNNYGFVNILMASFMAFWIKVFFKKYNYNYFEILVLVYFLLGMQMLMFSIFGLITSLVQIDILNNLVNFVILYICWAIGQFFDASKKMNYLKALGGYFFGMISFMAFVVICALVIDLIFK